MGEAYDYVPAVWQEEKNTMATDGPTPPDCDDEVFKHGTPFMMLGHWRGGSCAIERWRQRIAVFSGQRIDWHFFAGRAVFKVLGDVNLARWAAEATIDDIEHLVRDGVDFSWL